MKGLIDLHVHSTRSDGIRTVREVVAIAKQEGIRALALTDHDTVGGLAEARKECRKAGIEFISGIELGSQYHKAVDVLGLLIDPTHPALLKLVKTMAKRRELRAKRMVANLRGLGFDVTFKEVKARQTGDVIGKPHVARAVLAKKSNARIVKDAMGSAARISYRINDRLRRVGINVRPSAMVLWRQFFDIYLNPGGKAHVTEGYRLATKQAIDTVHAAGGIAVIAHPGLEGYELSAKELDELIDLGVDGIEVWRGLRRDKSFRGLLETAEKRGIIKTEGSDYHGFGIWDHLGYLDPAKKMPIRYNILERMKKHIKAKRNLRSKKGKRSKR